MTGGAGDDLKLAAAEGVDTFITGEGPHWTYALAEELGINVLYGGHYATETFGVKALAAHLAENSACRGCFSIIPPVCSAGSHPRTAPILLHRLPKGGGLE